MHKIDVATSWIKDQSQKLGAKQKVDQAQNLGSKQKVNQEHNDGMFKLVAKEYAKGTHTRFVTARSHA